MGNKLITHSQVLTIEVSHSGIHSLKIYIEMIPTSQFKTTCMDSLVSSRDDSNTFSLVK